MEEELTFLCGGFLGEGVGHSTEGGACVYGTRAIVLEIHGGLLASVSHGGGGCFEDGRERWTREMDEMDEMDERWTRDGRYSQGMYLDVGDCGEGEEGGEKGRRGEERGRRGERDGGRDRGCVLRSRFS